METIYSNNGKLGLLSTACDIGINNLYKKPRISILRTDSDIYNGSNTTYVDFGTQSFGNEHPDRFIFVCASAMNLSGGSNPTDLYFNMDGNSFDDQKIWYGTETYTDNTVLGFGWKKTPSGTSGNIEVYSSYNLSSWGIIVYSLLYPESTINFWDTGMAQHNGTTSSGSVSFNIDLPTNGLFIGLAQSRDARDGLSWSSDQRISEDIELNINTYEYLSSSLNTPTTSASSVSTTVNFSYCRYGLIAVGASIHPCGETQ